MYFESHAHYDDERFDNDREFLLGGELQKKGVKYIVNSAASMESSKIGITLSEKYSFVYCSVGVHPHDVKNITENDIDTLKTLSKNKKVVAIGEIGLDFHYDYSPRDDQRYWFEKQLELSKEVEMPVIIHSREAAAECFDIIKKSGVSSGVIHCYSGSLQMALDYIEMGFYIGIGGTLTYKNARKAIEVVEGVPISKILIETDSPYLSPEPLRGQRNDSRNLKYVVERIAALKDISVDEVCLQTYNNAKNLFKI